MINQRYHFQPSTVKDGAWACTDTKLGIVVTYADKRFNESQQFRLVDDIENPDPLELAKGVRLMTDWLVANHPETLMYDPVTYKHDLRRRLGAAIKQAREASGLTVRDVEAATGYGKGQISRFEAGRCSVTLDTLGALARTVGLRLELVPDKDDIDLGFEDIEDI